jgi:hypothetical protein
MENKIKYFFVLGLALGVFVSDIIYFKLYKKEDWKSVLSRGLYKMAMILFIGCVVANML